MLPAEARPIGFGTWERESWDGYARRLSLPSDRAILEFYRQVPYDHFDHFNAHYPHFDLARHGFSILPLPAQDAISRIRYFNNEEMDWWERQFDEFERKRHDYIIYGEMSRNLTFPFPPVLLDTSRFSDVGSWVYGRPLHLVEGTHRFSYLRRMVSRGLISPDSIHEFVLVSPK